MGGGFLKDAIQKGAKPIVCEVTPPKGSNLSLIDSLVDSLRGRVSSFLVPEFPSAVMRMSSIFLAELLRRKGLDAIYEISPAHRNSIAFQGDIIGASAIGLSEVLLSNGVSPKLGDHPQAKEVFELDRDSMVEALFSLKEGRDLVGHELDGKIDVYVGIRVHYRVLTEEAMTLELKRVERWIEKGVSFFVTPIVFNEKHFIPFAEKVRGMGGRVVPSLTLLKSAGMARFINRHLEGVEVPEVFIREIMKAPDKPKAACEIAKKVYEAIYDYSDAFVIVPYGWDSRVPLLLDYLS